MACVMFTSPDCINLLALVKFCSKIWHISCWLGLDPCRDARVCEWENFSLNCKLKMTDVNKIMTDYFSNHSSSGFRQVKLAHRNQSGPSERAGGRLDSRFFPVHLVNLNQGSNRGSLLSLSLLC